MLLLSCASHLVRLYVAVAAIALYKVNLALVCYNRSRLAKATPALPPFSPGQDGPEGGTEKPSDATQLSDLFLPTNTVSFFAALTTLRQCVSTSKGCGKDASSELGQPCCAWPLQYTLAPLLCGLLFIKAPKHGCAAASAKPKPHNCRQDV